MKFELLGADSENVSESDLDQNIHPVHRVLADLFLSWGGIARVVLLTRRDSESDCQVVFDASRQGFTTVSRPLFDCPQLPVDVIASLFRQPEGLVLPIGAKSSEGEIKHALIQPIGLPVELMWYCEVVADTDRCQALVDELLPLWTLSGILFSRFNSNSGLAGNAGLLTSALYLDTILKHSSALISFKDLEGNLVLASHGYCQQLLHESGGEYLGKSVFDLFPLKISKHLWDADLAALEADEITHCELDMQHSDGTPHSYRIVKIPLRDHSGDLFRVCSLCFDITESKRVESVIKEKDSRLNYLAFHDSLTGLPNRALFYDRIEHSLSRAKRSGSCVGLMVLDLDRFKKINDSLSHDAGDLLLKAIARRLQDAVRETDTVARLGGDEFVVVLDDLNTSDDISKVALKILSSISHPVTIQNHEISTSVSIGISLCPDDGAVADELLKNAEVAMYKAKESGKNNYKFYTDGMNSSAARFLMLENDLRKAIETDQLTLHYQPQFDLIQGEMVGMEALVRWKHPESGIISPAHFVPLAEESGLIIALGEWVLRRACRDVKRWLDAGLYCRKVAVNLSPRQFRKTDFTKTLAEILRETEFPAAHLELEITESTAMEDAGRASKMMGEISEMGVSLAIDDFGTGYSSLAYLKQFPIHKLKIDRGFIKDITTDDNDAAIAKSIISLAHNMSLQVIAEGVELEEQALWLRERGCDIAQGYLYSMPLPEDRLLERLQENPKAKMPITNVSH